MKQRTEHTKAVLQPVPVACHCIHCDTGLGTGALAHWCNHGNQFRWLCPTCADTVEIFIMQSKTTTARKIRASLTQP